MVSAFAMAIVLLLFALPAAAQDDVRRFVTGTGTTSSIPDELLLGAEEHLQVVPLLVP